jgi:hypothetical protein
VRLAASDVPVFNSAPSAPGMMSSCGSCRRTQQPIRNRPRAPSAQTPRLRRGGLTRPLRPTLHPIGASNSSDRVPFSERFEAAQLSPSRVAKTRRRESANLGATFGAKAAANLAAPWWDISRKPAFSKP